MSRKSEEKFKGEKEPKDSIRDKILRKRRKLSEKELKEKSTLIKGNLFSLPEFQSAHTIAFYASLNKNKEVDTEDMIKETLALGKRVLLPVTDLIENKLVFSEISKIEDLAPGAFDIPEPVPEIRKIVPYDAIRLVVVPGVAFDLNGHRIGYGMGFYDEFLSKLSKYVTKVGLAFELQVSDLLPNEKHDVRLDYLITEERVVECK